MLLDLRAERRPGLLGRSDTLALLEIYVEKAVKQLHIAVPIVTGPEGMGRSAVLHELLERSRNTGRSGGYGCVRSGLGQALIDATTSLAVSIKSLNPDIACTKDLIDAAEAFRGRSPDEATEEGFVLAIDHLLYALSTALPDVPRGYVLCIDDLQLANDGRVRVFLEGLIALSSTGAPIPVVLTSSVGLGIRTIPQGLDQLQLRPLTNADLADIAQRQGVIATPEVIRQIGDYVEGRPGRAIEIIERASAKGLVDAHTVRAVIAESKILLAERTAAADAERLAAQARTAAPTQPAVAPKRTGYDRSLSGPHSEHVVTKSQVFLDGLEFVDPSGSAASATVSDATATDVDALPEIVADPLSETVLEPLASDVPVTDVDVADLPVADEAVDTASPASIDAEPVAVDEAELAHAEPAVAEPPAAELAAAEPTRVEHVVADPVVETVGVGVPEATYVGVPDEPVAAREPSTEPILPAVSEVPTALRTPDVALPVRQGGATRLRWNGEPTRTSAFDVTATPIELTPTQRRVLACLADAAQGDPVTPVSVAFVKRSLGEVSRFGGAASPVGDALGALQTAGLLDVQAGQVMLTDRGRQHVATQPDA